MTFAELERTSDLRSIPRLDRTEVRLLWHSDYWDGPRSGMLVSSGVEFWFECVQEDLEPDAAWYRRFAVIRLSPEQHAEGVRWHELFRRCVGTHTDYDSGGKRTMTVLPRKNVDEFYDAYRTRTPRDFSACEVVGWFER